MAMSSPPRIALSAAVLIAVGVMGYALGRRSTAVSAPASGDSLAVAQARQQVEALRTENIRLTQQRRGVTETNRPAAEGAPRPISEFTARDRLRVLAEVQRNRIATVVVSSVNRNGELSENFAKVFDLTEAEQGVLKQALAQARQRIDQLVAANTTGRREGDAFVVSVKPFDGGGDVYDTVMEAFAQTLGPERNAAFLTLERDQLANAFSGFGAEQRTVTIAREIQSNGGEPQLIVRDQKKGTRGSTISMMPLNTTQGLQDQYRWLAPYMTDISNLPPRPRTNPPPF